MPERDAPRPPAIRYPTAPAIPGGPVAGCAAGWQARGPPPRRGRAPPGRAPGGAARPELAHRRLPPRGPRLPRHRAGRGVPGDGCRPRPDQGRSSPATWSRSTASARRMWRWPGGTPSRISQADVGRRRRADPGDPGGRLPRHRRDRLLRQAARTGCVVTSYRRHRSGPRRARQPDRAAAPSQKLVAAGEPGRQRARSVSSSNDGESVSLALTG